MQNHIIFITAIFCLVSGSELQANDDINWLGSKFGPIELGDIDKIDRTAKLLKSSEDLSRLTAILHHTRSATSELTKQEEHAATIAIRLLSKSGYSDASSEIIPFLYSSDQHLRMDAAQALAIIKDDLARASLEKVTFERMNDIKSLDYDVRDELMDLVRCTFLATEPQQREAMLERLIREMQKIAKKDRKLALQAEEMFREYKAGVDEVDPVWPDKESNQPSKPPAKRTHLPDDYYSRFSGVADRSILMPSLPT